MRDLSCGTPAEEIDEERSASERGHGSYGELGRCDHGARERVCQDHGDGAAECGGGQQDAMVGTEQQAHDVGNQEADVADGAADGNGEAGEEGGGDVDEQAHAADIDAEVHGFLFAGEEQIQVGRSGVDSAGGGKKAYAENPAQTWLQRTGEVAHQPEDHAAEVAAAEGSHQKHNDGGKEGAADDAGEEQSGAVDLSLAAPEKINGGDGSGGAEECAKRSNQRGEPCGKGEVRLGNQSENGAKRGATGDAENVGIGEGIAEQGLEAGASDGKRGADYDGQKDARQANFDNDHAVIAGERAGLTQQDADEVAA